MLDRAPTAPRDEVLSRTLVPPAAMLPCRGGVAPGVRNWGKTLGVTHGTGGGLTAGSVTPTDTITPSDTVSLTNTVSLTDIVTLTDTVL